MLGESDFSGELAAESMPRLPHEGSSSKLRSARARKEASSVFPAAPFASPLSFIDPPLSDPAVAKADSAPLSPLESSRAPSAQRMLLVGRNIGHSLSPRLYGAVFKECGLSWRYDLIDAPDQERAQSILQRSDYAAANVTTPYKGAAFAMAHRSDDAACFSQGANLLIRREDKILAFNTDGAGFVASLRRGGFAFAGAKLAVCGTGPTAHAIACACAAEGAASVVMLSRSSVRASRIQARMASLASSGLVPASLSLHETKGAGMRCACRIRCETYESGREALRQADAVVDATPLGLSLGDAAPFDCSLLRAGQIAYDTVYGKGETAFVRGARQAGCTVFDGTGMLIGQAVVAFRLICEHLSLVPAPSEPFLCEVFSACL